MNSTVTLPELSAIVARAAATDSDTATRFILELVAQIESALAAGGPAEVDGIGVFARDAVSGRVTFTPDAGLADAVNAPFSLFEPVVLPQSAPQDVLDDDRDATVAAVADSVASEAEDEVERAESVATADASDAAEACAADSDTAVDDEAAAPEPAPEAEPAAHTDDTAPSAATEPSAPHYYDDEYESTGGGATLLPWLTALLGIIIGMGAGYWIGTRYGAPAVVVTQTVQATDCISENAAAATPQDSDAADTLRVVISAPEAEQAPKQPAKAAEPVYDTVSTSRFLTTIARDHYGRKDYWVFIYEANTDILRHPNRIPPGTRVVVPDLGDHAALDAATRARARELAREIYNRYDM